MATPSKDGTYNLNGVEVSFSSGYAVGLKKGGLEVDLTRGLREPSLEVEDAFVFVADRGNATYVGIWRKDGRAYVDPVEWIADRKEAEALGRANGQQAIWDFANGVEI